MKTYRSPVQWVPPVWTRDIRVASPHPYGHTGRAKRVIYYYIISDKHVHLSNGHICCLVYYVLPLEAGHIPGLSTTCTSTWALCVCVCVCEWANECVCMCVCTLTLATYAHAVRELLLGNECWHQHFSMVIPNTFYQQKQLSKASLLWPMTPTLSS